MNMNDEANRCAYRADLVRQLLPTLLACGMTVQDALKQIAVIESYVVSGTAP